MGVTSEVYYYQSSLLTILSITTTINHHHIKRSQHNTSSQYPSSPPPTIERSTKPHQSRRQRTSSRMSLFPIIPPSPTKTHPKMLSSSPPQSPLSSSPSPPATQDSAPSPPQSPHDSTNPTHFHIPHPHPHLPHISLRTHLSSLFAPTSYQQCTCSPYRIPDYTKYIIVDDEFVLVEEDGGPLCREGMIESEEWKTSGGKVMLRERKRRMSVHCFGG